MRTKKKKIPLKAGDVVQLKSGGPKMTIEGFQEMTANKATCIWFDGSTFCGNEISPNALEHCPTREKELDKLVKKICDLVEKSGDYKGTVQAVYDLIETEWS